MSPFTLVLAVLAQTLVLAGIVWKGGGVVSRLETIVASMLDEIRDLRNTRDEHIGILSRVVGQLSDLERRVGNLET